MFDLLELEGDSLVELPLRARRERLAQVLDTSGPVARLSETFEDGEALLEALRAQRLEGVVAKRASSRYQVGGRYPDWLKVKVRDRQEFVIAGYTEGAGRQAGSLGSLILAVRRDGVLEWVGNCGTGFTDRERERLLRRLRRLRRRTTPFPAEPRLPRVSRDRVVWVTPERRLRGRVRGVDATQGVCERPPTRGCERTSPRGTWSGNAPPSGWFAAVGASSGSGISGRSSGRRTASPRATCSRTTNGSHQRSFPHLRHRPFTMKRYPDGVEGKHFFQKDAPAHMPAWISTRALPATSRDGSGPGRSATRSSTTTWRCSGWRTWAAST